MQIPISALRAEIKKPQSLGGRIHLQVLRAIFLIPFSPIAYLLLLVIESSVSYSPPIYPHGEETILPVKKF